MKNGKQIGLAAGVVALAGIGAYFAFRKPAAAPTPTGSPPKNPGSSGAPGGGPGPGAQNQTNWGTWCTDAEAAAQGLDTHGTYKHDSHGNCVLSQDDPNDHTTTAPTSTWTGAPIPGAGPVGAGGISFQPQGCTYGFSQILAGPKYVCRGAGPGQVVSSISECDSGHGVVDDPIVRCT